MVIEFYQNKTNPHKYQEIHYDEYGHYTVKEVMRFENGIINQTGDGHLHRWKLKDVQNLLKDYKRWPDDETWYVIHATCLCCRKISSYVLNAEEEKAYDKYLEDKIYGKFPGYIQDIFPKMPEHIRAGIIAKDGTCCSCPKCNRIRKES